MRDAPTAGQSGSSWRRALFKSIDMLATDPIEALMGPGCSTLDFRIDDRSLTPLIFACIAKSPWLARALLRLGADPDFSDDSGWTPLHWACKTNAPAVVAVLLEAGADPNASRPGEKASCLHFCAQSASLACAELLMAQGADPHRVDPGTQASARHWCAHEVEMSLLLGGSDPGPDGAGRSILHWAIRAARDDAQATMACRHWVERGSCVLARDALGWLPVQTARSRSFWSCARYLDSVVERAALEETAPAPSSGGSLRI